MKKLSLLYWGLLCCLVSKGQVSTIAKGERYPLTIGDAQKLAGMLKAELNLRSTSRFMPNEDHLTILHNAVYSALQWINKPSIK